MERRLGGFSRVGGGGCCCCVAEVGVTLPSALSRWCRWWWWWCEWCEESSEALVALRADVSTESLGKGGGPDMSLSSKTFCGSGKTTGVI